MIHSFQVHILSGDPYNKKSDDKKSDDKKKTQSGPSIDNIKNQEDTIRPH